MILTSRRQQRVLGEMLSELCSSDPYIVAGFATFSRLTESEPMPRFEQVRLNVVGSARSFFRRLIRRRRRAHQRLGATTA